MVLCGCVGKQLFSNNASFAPKNTVFPWKNVNGNHCRIASTVGNALQGSSGRTPKSVRSWILKTHSCSCLLNFDLLNQFFVSIETRFLPKKHSNSMVQQNEGFIELS